MSTTFINRGHFYAPHVMPVLLDCNFIVDSTNGNGLGIRSLKGQGISNVYMNTQNQAGGGLALGTSGSYAILAATAITNTGSSVLTGNLGEYPGTAVTGFPPGTFSGSLNIANGSARNAKASAQAAFTAGQTSGLSGTTIASELGGQTLTPGSYQFASGTAGISLTTGHSTLTFNGSGTYIIYTATTLLTGATGSADLPTFAFTGTATASNTNIYWIVGSSATINQAAASAGAVFYGTVIASTSITATQAGTINGNLIALNGAVTLSAANTIIAQPITPNFLAPGNPNPAPGYILVQLTDNYMRYFGGFSGFESPLDGDSDTDTVAGVPNVIVSLGTATRAQWLAAGLPPGVTPAVGVSFIPTATGVIGGSAAVQGSTSNSGVDHIELVGDPNLSLGPVPVGGSPNVGGWLLFECVNQNNIATPADGTIVGMSFYLSQSSVVVKGE